jgi:micrococcal nuclease
MATLVAVTPAWSAALPTCAPVIEARGVKIVRVERNGVLVLADGRAVHLEGLILPQGAKDHAPEFLAQQAITALSDLTKDRAATLAVNDPKEDRYDRIRAQVEFPQDRDEPWLQIAMLRRGLARVSIAPDRRECAGKLYAAEDEARQKKYGIWAQAFYRLRTPDDLAGTAGTFQIVEGKVASVRKNNGNAYLDFGRPGFAVMISADDMGNFFDDGVDPRNYAGKTVRVRGYVYPVDGLELEASSPQSFEVLPAE